MTGVQTCALPIYRQVPWRADRSLLPRASPEATSMTACLLDGTSAAAAWRAAIAADARAVVDDLGYAPVLATVIAPGDPSSAAYARAISRACARAGVGSRVVELPNGSTDAELVACLRELNADDHVHGIIVQLPLPPAYTAAAVGATLAPEKDVDGVTPLSAGLLAQIGRAHV